MGTLESWIACPRPSAIPLATFYEEALKFPEALDAPVRQIRCYRHGTRYYILVACHLLVPKAQAQSSGIVYFRIERRSTKGGIESPDRKPCLVTDTVQASTSIEPLYRFWSSLPVGGHLTFHPEDNAPNPIALERVLEIYTYLVMILNRHCPRVLYVEDSCRWICYGLLECLRGCEPCFGGHWSRCISEIPKQDSKMALWLKEGFLKNMHPRCCALPPPGLTVRDLVTTSNSASPPIRVSLFDSSSLYSERMPGSPSLCMISLGSRSMNWRSRSRISITSDLAVAIPYHNPPPNSSPQNLPERVNKDGYSSDEECVSSACCES